MRRTVSVLTLLVGLGACVSAKDHRILMEKYAHTLAIKNEIDLEYGDLHKQVALLEQGHGKLAAALAEAKQTQAGVAGQMRLLQQNVDAINGLVKKEAQEIQELRAALAPFRQEATDLKRTLTDSQAELRTGQEDLNRRLTDLQRRLQSVGALVGRLNAKAKAAGEAPESSTQAPDRGKGAKPAKSVKKAGKGQTGEPPVQDTPGSTKLPEAPVDAGPSPLMELKPNAPPSPP